MADVAAAFARESYRCRVLRYNLLVDVEVCTSNGLRKRQQDGFRMLRKEFYSTRDAKGRIFWLLLRHEEHSVNLGKECSSAAIFQVYLTGEPMKARYHLDAGRRTRDNFMSLARLVSYGLNHSDASSSRASPALHSKRQAKLDHQSKMMSMRTLVRFILFAGVLAAASALPEAAVDANEAVMANVGAANTAEHIVAPADALQEGPEEGAERKLQMESPTTMSPTAAPSGAEDAGSGVWRPVPSVAIALASILVAVTSGVALMA